ncbi:MAG: hypothetical protein HY938_06350 [Nitrosomonadales bacterium]|nr:hypothetical protein [Nitrosomonadales bacterium]
MEERSNKTIMCSVLFLDIVEYSKKSVSGQISLKDRFNSYLSEAIRDVPVTDRIILDTGDGAAINFLGDVEDALKAALSLRESLLNEDPEVDHPLLVRMGINLGPVRLVRDINGQPNIVGDGINVAQRVMGFADAAQILVSRSYYDAVSRLSPQYAGMFHYQGSRTDKHVREHEVYAIGYPGDKTTLKSRTKPAVVAGSTESSFSGKMKRIQDDWHSFLALLDTRLKEWLDRYRKAQAGQRVLYTGIIAVPLLLVVVLLVKLVSHDQVPAKPGVVPQVEKRQPVAAPVAPLADSAISKKDEAVSKPAAAEQPEAGKATQGAKPKDSMQDKQKDKFREKPKPKDQPIEVQQEPKVQEKVVNKPAAESTNGGTEARISVYCTAGTEVFVDGVRKGSITSRSLAIVMPPGAHTVIVSHTSGGIYSQNVILGAGKTVDVRPNFCQ